MVKRKIKKAANVVKSLAKPVILSSAITLASCAPNFIKNKSEENAEKEGGEKQEEFISIPIPGKSYSIPIPRSAFDKKETIESEIATGDTLKFLGAPLGIASEDSLGNRIFLPIKPAQSNSLDKSPESSSDTSKVKPKKGENFLKFPENSDNFNALYAGINLTRLLHDVVLTPETKKGIDSLVVPVDGENSYNVIEIKRGLENIIEYVKSDKRNTFGRQKKNILNKYQGILNKVESDTTYATKAYLESVKILDKAVQDGIISVQDDSLLTKNGLFATKDGLYTLMVRSDDNSVPVFIKLFGKTDENQVDVIPGSQGIVSELTGRDLSNPEENPQGDHKRTGSSIKNTKKKKDDYKEGHAPLELILGGQIGGLAGGEIGLAKGKFAGTFNYSVGRDNVSNSKVGEKSTHGIVGESRIYEKDFKGKGLTMEYFSDKFIPTTDLRAFFDLTAMKWDYKTQEQVRIIMPNGTERKKEGEEIEETKYSLGGSAGVEKYFKGGILKGTKGRFKVGYDKLKGMYAGISAKVPLWKRR